LILIVIKNLRINDHTNHLLFIILKVSAKDKMLIQPHPQKEEKSE
jgi:hypothetical protein